MTRILASKWPEERGRVAVNAGGFVLWLSAAACACRPAVVSGERSASPGLELREVRRPDGVFVDPYPAIPSAVERAEAHGVVALREPVDANKVREVVLGISDAWKHGSLGALTDLLTADAVQLDAPKGGRVALVERWRERLRAVSLDRLPSGCLFTIELLSWYSYDDMSDSGAPARPATMRPGDVYVRVPFEATQLGSEQVFGDELVLVLRRDGDRLRVAGYGETASP